MNKDIELLINEGEGLTVEFKEKYSPKIAQDMIAFANSRGGKILLGVADDGTITGEKITNKMKAEILDMARNFKPSFHVSARQVENIVVIEVPESDKKPHMCSSGFFKRLDAITQKLAPEDIRNIFKSQASFYYDAEPHPKCTIKDLSMDKVLEFIKEAKIDTKIDQDTLPDFLESLGLLEHEKLTNAAVVMFAKDVSKFMIHCQIHLVAFKGTERVNIYDKKYVRDDLLTQFREAESFIKKHLNERAEIRGMRRHDIYEIPIPAIREAIVNAIIHRDYTIGGTNIQVEVLADRVEISNPGGLPEGLTKSMFGKKSVRRNELLADLFHRMDKSERIGSGIPRIKRLLLEAKLKPAIFNSDSFFTVTFARSEEYRTVKNKGKGSLKKFTEKVHSKSSLKLGKTAQKIVNIIKENPNITSIEMAKLLDISDRAVKKQLANLQTKGAIARIGADKGGTWKVL